MMRRFDDRLDVLELAEEVWLLDDHCGGVIGDRLRELDGVEGAQVGFHAIGYLFLTGRIKNVINRGGEKISPEHVEAVLSECGGVTEAAVFAIPDATYGERVGAAVVVGGEQAITADQILDNCSGRLAPFEVPDRLEVVAALPHTAKGALDRRAVEKQFRTERAAPVSVE